MKLLRPGAFQNEPPGGELRVFENGPEEPLYKVCIVDEQL